MQKIEAIIHPFTLDQICQELSGMRVSRIIATEIMDVSEKREFARVYSHPASRTLSQFLEVPFSDSVSSSKVKLEVIIPESKAKRVISAIARAAKTSDSTNVRIIISVVERSIE